MLDVVSSLTELQQPHLAHMFVKQVSIAIITFYVFMFAFVYEYYIENTYI